MALKGEHQIFQDDITYMCDVVAERGCTLVVKTAGSGVSIGDSAGVASLLSAPSGYKVAGILWGDVVDVDLTRYKLNQHKNQTKTGNRVRLIRKGIVTTDKVTGSPTDGDPAYLTANGVVTPTLSTTGGLVATPRVGTFRSSKDEASYAKVEINLPY